MTIDVGPYRFSVNDARATLAHVDDLLDLYPPEAHESLSGLRSELHQLTSPPNSSSDDALEAALVGEVFPRILSARQSLVELGLLPSKRTGSVGQLSTSTGGVPKIPVDNVEVDFGGITTDRQATRKHHGRPWQALCLWSNEVINDLRKGGHPISAGSSGENITLTGIDWSLVAVGTQLQIGSVLLQITAAAVPCAQNAQWFSDRNFDRIHHRHGPVSRMYATVIKPGSIATGDPAVLELD